MNDIIKVLDGVAFAESQIVCKRFEKEHRDTLSKIDEIIRDLTVSKSAVKNYFTKGIYTNDRNREYRNYLMTRDGFSLLAMSYTGKKAMSFKVRYIEAFNKMESSLKAMATSRAIGKEIRKSLTDEVKDSGENERMHGYGYSNYTKFAYKTIGLHYRKPKKGEPDFRDTLLPGDLDRLKTVESMIKSLLEIGNEYEQVKKTINEIFGPKKLLKGE